MMPAFTRLMMRDAFNAGAGDWGHVPRPRNSLLLRASSTSETESHASRLPLCSSSTLVSVVATKALVTHSGCRYGRPNDATPASWVQQEGGEGGQAASAVAPKTPVAAAAVTPSKEAGSEGKSKKDKSDKKDKKGWCRHWVRLA